MIVKFKLAFVPKCDPKEINLIWPRGGIKEFLQANSTSHVLTLRKRVPEPDGETTQISQLDFDIRWKPRPTSVVAQMGCYASASDRPADKKATGSGTNPASKDKPAAEGRRGGILEVKPTQVTEGGTQTQTDTATGGEANVPADIVPEAPVGMKACPICTYLNIASATICEMCMTPFS